MKCLLSSLLALATWKEGGVHSPGRVDQGSSALPFPWPCLELGPLLPSPPPEFVAQVAKEKVKLGLVWVGLVPFGKELWQLSDCLKELAHWFLLQGNVLPIPPGTLRFCSSPGTPAWAAPIQGLRPSQPPAKLQLKQCVPAAGHS